MISTNHICLQQILTNITHYVDWLERALWKMTEMHYLYHHHFAWPTFFFFFVGLLVFNSRIVFQTSPFLTRIFCFFKLAQILRYPKSAPVACNSFWTALLTSLTVALHGINAPNLSIKFSFNVDRLIWCLWHTFKCSKISVYLNPA